MEIRLPPKKEWDLTQESFAKFLLWLDPNRDEAGRKYEAIRHRLIKIFVCRGCTCPEDLSDETINRVIHKAQEVAESYEGDPASYFYGVANNIHREYLRKKPTPQRPSPPEERSTRDDEYECLEQCMQALRPRSRELVLEYYREERQAKIDCRKQLALRLGIPLNALRIRAFRIRMNLQTCMSQCLREKAAK